MDNKLLLAKCVTLIYKESLLKEKDNNSKALIEEAISKVQPREIGLNLGLDKDVVNSLKETVRDLLVSSHDQSIDKAGLIQRIRINVGENDKLYNAIERSISEEQTEEELQRSIKSAKKAINEHIKDLKVSELLTGAAASWNFHRDKITDTGAFLRTFWSQLEPLSALKVVQDKAIIDQVRLGDKDQVNKVISDIYTSVTENRVYKTGWQALNLMLQDGIRPGETWIQAALQHQYKTGFTQSIFDQIAVYNRPMTNIPKKKPALVLLSFEDKMSERFNFIFKHLKYSETREFVDISGFTVEEIQNYVLARLGCNGFEIFLYRIDPGQWTYIDIFNLITDLGNQGYSIEFVAADYLEKVPTTGCNSSSIAGNDLLEMFNKVRTFFSTRGIPFWTPHQLSTDSKQLIRGAITEDKFVQALVGRGYYKGSRQLDQIPDGIIFTHKFSRGSDTYLAVQRDRHRITSILDEKYKHFFLKFPKGMPIPDDLYSDDSSLRKLPPYQGNSSDSLFSFDD